MFKGKNLTKMLILALFGVFGLQGMTTTDVTAAKQYNFYDMLGVGRNATLDQIKTAYRRLALTYHPDRVEEGNREVAAEHFQKISQAYSVMSNSTKKYDYDNGLGYGDLSKKVQEYKPITGAAQRPAVGEVPQPAPAPQQPAPSAAPPQYMPAPPPLTDADKKVIEDYRNKFPGAEEFMKRDLGENRATFERNAKLVMALPTTPIRKIQIAYYNLLATKIDSAKAYIKELLARPVQLAPGVMVEMEESEMKPGVMLEKAPQVPEVQIVVREGEAEVLVPVFTDRNAAKQWLISNINTLENKFSPNVEQNLRRAFASARRSFQLQPYNTVTLKQVQQFVNQAAQAKTILQNIQNQALFALIKAVIDNELEEASPPQAKTVQKPATGNIIRCRRGICSRVRR